MKEKLFDLFGQQYHGLISAAYSGARSGITGGVIGGAIIGLLVVYSEGIGFILLFYKVGLINVLLRILFGGMGGLFGGIIGGIIVGLYGEALGRSYLGAILGIFIAIFFGRNVNVSPFYIPNSELIEMTLGALIGGAMGTIFGVFEAWIEAIRLEFFALVARGAIYGFLIGVVLINTVLIQNQIDFIHRFNSYSQSVLAALLMGIMASLFMTTPAGICLAVFDGILESGFDAIKERFGRTKNK